VVKNKDPEATIEVYREFSEGEGYTFQAPFLGKSDFKLIVKPMKTEVGVIKTNVMSFGASIMAYEKVILSDKQLIKKCKAEGEKEELDGTEKCFKYQLKHSGGILIVYENQGQKTIVLESSISFEGLNLHVNGQQQSENEVKLEIKPDSQQVIKLEVSGGDGYSFGYQHTSIESKD